MGTLFAPTGNFGHLRLLPFPLPQLGSHLGHLPLHRTSLQLEPSAIPLHCPCSAPAVCHRDRRDSALSVLRAMILPLHEAGSLIFVKSVPQHVTPLCAFRISCCLVFLVLFVFGRDSLLLP